MKHIMIVLSLVLLSTGAWIGNTKVIPRGPTEHLLLNGDDHAVEERENLGEEVIIIVPFETPGAARLLADREKELCAQFQCLGLSTIFAPREMKDPGDQNLTAIVDYPILCTDPQPWNPLGCREYGMLPEDWIAIAEADRTLRHFTFIVGGTRYVISTVFLPRAMTQQEAIEKVLAVADIDNLDKWPQGTRVTGWPLFRSALNKKTTESFASFLSLSMLLVILPLFWIRFGSLPLALCGVGTIFFALFLTRGVMGLTAINETMFLVISCAAIVVFGQSAVLRMFEKGAMVHTRLWIIAAFSSIGFLTYFFPIFGFEVLPVRELGGVAIVGILIVNAFAVTLFAWAAARWRRDPYHLPRYSRLMEQVMRQIAYAHERIAWFFARSMARAASLAVVVVLIFLSSLFLLIRGYIATETDPRMYIPDDLTVKAFELLDHKDASGGLLLSYWVRTRNDSFVNPQHLRALTAWTDEVQKAVDEIGGLYSPLTGVHQATFVSSFYDHIIPSTSDRAKSIWNRMDLILADMRSQLWRDDAMRVAFSARIATDVQIERALARIDEINARYPDLMFEKVGLNPTFAKSRHYVTEGKINNMISTPLTMSLFVAVMLMIWTWGWQRTLPWWSAAVTTIPFVFGFSVFLLLLLLLQKPLDIVSATITSLSVSSAGDTTLHFLIAFLSCLKQEKGAKNAWSHTFMEEGPRIVTDMLFNAALFIPLLAGPIPPLQTLGMSMALIMLLNMVGTLILMPPIFYQIALRQEQEKAPLKQKIVSRPWQKAAAL